MTSRTRETQGDTLKQDQIALDNVENLPEIAVAMTELGYDGESLTEGKNLLAETRHAYHQNIIVSNEATKAILLLSSDLLFLKNDL